MRKKTRLILLLMIFVTACGLAVLERREISPMFGTSEQTVHTAPPEFSYPKTFPLKQLNDGLSNDFGLLLIGELPDLRGSLAFAGVRHSSIKASIKISALQKLTLSDGKLARVQNFELPPYDYKVVGAIRDPLFRNQNHCFVHVTRRGSDVGQFQLYELDLEAKQGSLAQDRMFAFNRLLISPSGKNYAYETAEPYNNAWYHLVVVSDKGKRVISESSTTEVFSWTPRNTLIYPDYLEFVNPSTGYTNEQGIAVPKVKPNPEGHTKNYGYPDIYEDNIKGNVKLIKSGGYLPLMSPDGEYLANFVAYVEPNNRTVDRDAVIFRRYGVGRVALAVYDMNTKRDHIVTRIYEQYPDLFWSKDGSKLYVVEKSYTFSKKTAWCRISQYDTKTRKYKLICRLEQKGTSKVYDDGRLMPHFLPVKLANDKYLLLTVQVHFRGGGNFHVLAVDLATGARSDIFAFTSVADPYNVPSVDWIDATADKTG